MYTIELTVIKSTTDEPESISKETTILELAGLNPQKGLKGIGMTSDSDGVVFDNDGNYGYLPHGYYVTYEEVAVDY